MTIAVPISWPTTMTPDGRLAADVVDAADRALEALGIHLDHDLALVEHVQPLERGALHRRDASGEFLADPDGAALDLLRDLLRRERLEQGRPRLGDGGVAKVDVERQRPRGLLGLDDGLHGEGQLAVQAQTVVEDGAEEAAQGTAERRRLAVDQVLAGQPVDVVAERRPRRTTGSACRGPSARRRCPGCPLP